MDKTTVLKFLAFPPESNIEIFNQGRQLYSQAPNRNQGVERDLNRDGFSRDRLGTLIYELAKAHGITQKEIQIYKAENTKIAERSILERLLDEENLPILYTFKIQKEYPLLAELHPWPDNIEEILSKLKNEATKLGEIFDGQEEEAEGLILSETLQNHINEISLPEDVATALNVFYPGAADAYNAAKVVLYGDDDEKEENADKIIETLEAKLSELRGASSPVPDQPVQEPAAQPEPSPEDKKDEQYSIRKEYPFLNDENCPNELKILVADKIAAYHRYSEYHAQLREHNAGALQLSAAEVTDLTANAEHEFALNQAIAKELDFYKENQKVLGEHPVFKELAMQRKIDAMTNEEAHTYITSSAPYVSRKKKSINEVKSDDKRAKLQVELEDREKMILLAKKKLNLV